MELEVRLARLEEVVRAGFRRQESMHRENTRARELDARRTDEAHTKVDKLDQAVAGAWKEIVRIRENYHQLRNWITGVHPEQALTLPPPQKEAREPKDMATGENRPVTQSDLKWIIGLIITCLGAGAGITIWILKVAGAIK